MQVCLVIVNVIVYVESSQIRITLLLIINAWSNKMLLVSRWLCRCVHEVAIPVWLHIQSKCQWSVHSACIGTYFLFGGNYYVKITTEDHASVCWRNSWWMFIRVSTSWLRNDIVQMPLDNSGFPIISFPSLGQ